MSIKYIIKRQGEGKSTGILEFMRENPNTVCITPTFRQADTLERRAKADGWYKPELGELRRFFKSTSRAALRAIQEARPAGKKLSIVIDEAEGVDLNEFVGFPIAAIALTYKGEQ